MSSMMDLLGGGAPPAAGAPPPDPAAGGGDLMSLLGGGGAPSAPEETAADTSQEDGGDETSDYQEALEALQRASSRPTTDHQETAKIQKCISAIQDLLATNEKMVDQTMGTSPNLRKALAGGASSGPSY